MLVVVGNKTDLLEERAVDAATAQEYAISIGASYFETSALDNTGKRLHQIWYNRVNMTLKGRKLAKEDKILAQK